MSMLDIHSEALAKVDEAFHSFLLRYRADGNIVYGFVEGKEDPMFYRSIIERFIPPDWDVELIKGGGKIKVLNTLNNMDWTRFNAKRIAFFLDRDVDQFCGIDPIASENVYQTDGYSIENSIVTSELFIRLLIECFNLSDLTPSECQLLKRNFEQDLVAFQKLMAPIMAQIIAWRADGTTAYLNDLDLRPMSNWSDGRFKLSTSYRTRGSRLNHASTCVGAKKSEEARQRAIEREFSQQAGPQSFTRGKYLLWFLAETLCHVHSNIAKLTSTYNCPPKTRIGVGPANVVIVAAPRARCPQSLRDFIDKTFICYINSLSAA